VVGADESWYFIDGAPVELLLCCDHDQPVASHRLGFGNGHPDLEPVGVVPAGWWQAARSLGPWSLVSCCVGPGFDFADFELDAGRPLPF
jgi:predicted cupin superfamily sugar epimerase